MGWLCLFGHPQVIVLLFLWKINNIIESGVCNDCTSLVVRGLMASICVVVVGYVLGLGLG